MKKIYKSLMLAAASLIGFSSAAQVSAYSFAQLAGSYVTIPTSGPSATAIAVGNYDDNVFSNIPIGFNFTYNATTYSTVALNVNGWISMGTVTPGSSYNPISSGTASNVVSFFGRDLRMAPAQSCTTTLGSNTIALAFAAAATNAFAVGDTVIGTGIPANATVTAITGTSLTISANATAAGTNVYAKGYISYNLTGVTPNRVFTIQWKRVGRYNQTSTGLNDYVNGQIKLYETTNVIEIVYGNCGTNNANSSTVEIGLRGISTADFNNRAIATGGSFATSTAGAVNTANGVYNATTTIPSGQIYRWTPPNLCTGAPNAGTVPASFSICPNTTAIITNTSSNLATGITYQWMEAPAAAGPWTNVTTGSGFNTVSLTTASLTSLTFYQLVITCTNSAQSVTTAIMSVNPNNPATLCYCNQSLGGSGCTGDNITNVSILGTLFNNNSTCNTTPANGTYSQFAPSPSTTASLSAGASYSISVNTTASNIESVWIDYNQNGIFEATEHTQITTSSTANVATIAVFNVPATAVLGQTGMRVRSRGTGNPNGPTDACTNFGSGETEDYIVTIVAGTPCSGAPASTSIVATSTAICSGNTVTLSLANTYTETGITYQWFSASSVAGPFTAISNATLTSYPSSALTTNTFYVAVVTCANGPASTTLTSTQISILAGPAYATVPFLENFDNTWQNRCDNHNVPVSANWDSNPTTGNASWRRQDDGGTALWTSATIGTVTPLAGAGCANFHSYYAASAATGELNLYVNLNSSSTYTTSFYYYNASGTDSLEVFLSTDGGATFTKKGGYTVNASWNKKTILLPAVNSPTCVIKFKATSDFGNDDIAIDSLQIQTCVVPTVSLSASQTTICDGSSTNLIASGATTYTWNTTATTSSISVTPSVTTSYTVMAENMPGCPSTNTISITVNPTPTLVIGSSSLTVCSGNTVNIGITGANTYTWSTGANGASISPTVTSTTNYSVTGSSAAGCNSTASVTINANANPTVNATSSASLICSGQSATLTASGASTFTWNTTSTNTAIAVSPTTTTSYTVTGTNASGCTNAFVISQAVSPCTGIGAKSASSIGIMVYPNPNTGEFTVELNNGSVKTIQVTDLTGRVILSSTTSNDKVDFNINSLANGVYFVKVQSNNSVEVIKIVKQ